MPWLAQKGPVAVIGILSAAPGAQRGLSRPQNRGFSSDLNKPNGALRVIGKQHFSRARDWEF